MTKHVDLYDGHYGHLGADPQTEVRKETYGDDLGQASWITLKELRVWLGLLRLDNGCRVLEVACGSGGVTCRVARETGAACVGVDINAHGIEAATRLAEREGLSSRVSFQVVDASRSLPFPDASFDAVLCTSEVDPARLEREMSPMTTAPFESEQSARAPALTHHCRARPSVTPPNRANNSPHQRIEWSVP